MTPRIPPPTTITRRGITGSLPASAVRTPAGRQPFVRAQPSCHVQDTSRQGCDGSTDRTYSDHRRVVRRFHVRNLVSTGAPYVACMRMAQVWLTMAISTIGAAGV